MSFQRREELTICQDPFLNGGDLKGLPSEPEKVLFCASSEKDATDISRGKRKVSFFWRRDQNSPTHLSEGARGGGTERAAGEKKVSASEKLCLEERRRRRGQGKVGHVGSRFAAVACSLKGGKPLFSPVWLSNQGGEGRTADEVLQSTR